jgi:ribosomal protein L6P/L9E
MVFLYRKINYRGAVVGCFFDLYKQIIILKGRLGRVIMPLDRKLLIIARVGKLKLFVSKYSKFFAMFEKQLRGVTYGWFVSLNLIGIQYIMKYSKRARFLTFSLGFNSLLKYRVFKDLYVYKKKRNVFLYGWDFEKVFAIARFLRRIKNLEPYKVKGFIFSGETVKLKPGKRQKK